MSSYPRKLYALSAAVVLAGALSGCATYEKCGLEGCTGDAKVTSNVQTLFNQHPELGAQGALEAQGLLNEGGDLFAVRPHRRLEVGSLAQSAPGVTQVVNSIAVTH